MKVKEKFSRSKKPFVGQARRAPLNKFGSHCSPAINLSKIEGRAPARRRLSAEKRMMEKKGTVTELSSLFPAKESHKASLRVQDEITERQQQLNQLKGFIDDNVSLINLVQKLPDEAHHNIMVPFGKAAFFPGRLIRTNEFMYTDGILRRNEEQFLQSDGPANGGQNRLNRAEIPSQVLLGEGYYAGRTSKQTIDILKRRGKA